jgi:hypothetical protein
MRCPNCAGEVPAGSRFCGICGRNVTAAAEAPLAHAIGDGGRWPAAPAQPDAQAAMSLFELPAARRPRVAKMALVLVLDAILAGAGIVMILSYLDARKPPPPPVKPARSAAAAVEVGSPEAVVAGEAPATPAGPAPKGQKQATGDRRQATGDRTPVAKQPAAAVPVVTPIAETAAVEETSDELDAVSARLTEMVGRHSGDLERCYQRVAKVAGPGDPLEGKIDIHVTVMPDGSARDVHAGENTTGSAQLADCVVSLFQSWTLPAGAAEPVELLWPLQFRAPAK